MSDAGWNARFCLAPGLGRTFEDDQGHDFGHDQGHGQGHPLRDRPSAVLTTGSESAASEAEETVFARLVARHSTVMFRVAFSLLRNAQDAEDAVQEALLKLCRTGAWRRMGDEKAFLVKTVWRVALDRLPKRRESPLEAGEASVSGESVGWRVLHLR